LKAELTLPAIIPVWYDSGMIGTIANLIHDNSPGGSTLAR